jgi:hypothetical protein
VNGVGHGVLGVGLKVRLAGSKTSIVCILFSALFSLSSDIWLQAASCDVLVAGNMLRRKRMCI